MTASIAHRLEHFLVTLDTLLELGDLDSVSRILASIGPLWEAHEFLPEGLHYASRLIDSGHWRGSPDVLFAQVSLLAGNFARHQSQYALARQHYGAGLLAATPQFHVHIGILGGLGEIAFRQGDYAESQKHYDAYRAVSQSAGDECGVADALTALGRIALAQGDVLEAERLLADSQSICERRAYRFGRAWLLNARGELERARAQPHAALAHYTESAAIFAELENPGDYMLVQQNRAAALIAAEEHARAELLLPTLLEFWARGNAVHPLMLGLLSWSEILGRRGASESAALLLTHVVNRLTAVGARLESGDGLLLESVQARLSRQPGAQAWATVRRRAETLTDAEALALTQAPQTAPVAPLSSREREILALVMQGLPDKQIARACAISPHTVNAHLRKIYQKLGVNTRVAAVIAARTANLI